MGIVGLYTVLQICTKAKISVLWTSFLILISPGKKHNIYRPRSGLHIFMTLRRMFYIQLFSYFMMRENFPLQRNLLLNLETN
jgi:hypothetical protein